MTLVEQVNDRLRAELTAAMRRRDQVAVCALRTLLAAVANAEAPPIENAPREVHGRLAEHDRRALTAEDLAAVVDQLIADRLDTIGTYRANGRDDAADELQREVDVLAAIKLGS
jgi:uncharacterized protein YqeY